MKKKLLLLFILVGASIALAGCSLTEDTNSNKNNTQEPMSEESVDDDNSDQINLLDNDPEELTVNTSLSGTNQQEYVEDELCSPLGEEDCFNNDNCYGIYGSSFCSGNNCTTDGQFTVCQRIPEEIIEQTKRDKALCQDTGGEWRNNRLNMRGTCYCEQSYFRETEGCMSMEDDCEKFGGTIFEPGTLECDEHLRATDPFTCPESNKYNTFKECVCPSGEVWDYRNRCL
jgi:hypothetical protein